MERKWRKSYTENYKTKSGNKLHLKESFKRQSFATDTTITTIEKKSITQKSHVYRNHTSRLGNPTNVTTFSSV